MAMERFVKAAEGVGDQRLKERDFEAWIGRVMDEEIYKEISEERKRALEKINKEHEGK